MRLLILGLALLMCVGCATVDRATDLGGKIGNSFAKSAAKGEPMGEVALKSWPYVKGVIEGLMGPNYDLEINPIAEKIMDELDRLSALPPEDLTSRDKGYILGSLCRLEAVAIEQTWDRYGVNLWKLMTGG